MMGNEQNNKFVYSEECDSLLEDALKTDGISETLQKFFYIISLYPNCDFAYYEIGIYFKNSGLYKDAIKYFEKAEEINSNFDEYFAELGFCYEAIKKYKKAEYYYKKAFEINGKNSNTKYYWADYLVNTLKDYGQAEKIIEDLVFEYPQLNGISDNLYKYIWRSSFYFFIHFYVIYKVFSWSFKFET